MPGLPSAPFDRLYADVKIAIPGMTDAVFQQLVFSVMKDFCDKTNIWSEEVPIPVVPNTFSYAFSVAGGGAPNRLLLLFDPARADPDKKWVQSNVQMMVPGVITLSYAPSTATTWNAIVAKVPTDPTNSENYPDIPANFFWIVDKYRDGLWQGIVGRAMMLPAKPYTDTKTARWYWQNYVVDRGKARTDAVHANVYGGQRWVFPQAFATTTRKGWT